MKFRNVAMLLSSSGNDPYSESSPGAEAKVQATQRFKITVSCNFRVGDTMAGRTLTTRKLSLRPVPVTLRSLTKKREVEEKIRQQ